MRELAHRVLMASYPGTEVPPWLLRRLADGLGSVCLFGSNVDGNDARTRATTDELHAAAPAGCLIAMDEEGGDVTRLDAGTGSPLPGPAAMGAVDEPALTYAVAASLGHRLRRVGVDLDLAPVADVNSEPDNPVIGVRSFGADPHLVARHVTAFTTGLQDAGVAACVKHYPGHGASIEDSHTAAPRLDAPVTLLRGRELVPFAAAIAAGTAAVMTSHVVVGALDAARPATTSPRAVELLRRELGFAGLLVTDALDMAGVAQPYGGVPGAAVAALAAGADLLCLGSASDDDAVEAVVTAVLDAVSTGRLPAARLIEAAARVDDVVHHWTRGGPVPADEAGGAAAEVARRALRVDGDLPAVGGALVAELAVAPNIAAGEVPRSLARPLAALDPRVEGVAVRAGDAMGPVLSAAAGRPLVAVVRDAHRHPWVGDALAALADARPDLVVVETGWPLHDDSPRPWRAAALVHTYGAAAVSLRAAAELLAGASAQAGGHR